MTAPDPRILESIFLAALNVEPAERPAAIARMCDGDEAMQREVESLLRFHEHTSGALDRSPLLSLSAGLAGTREDEQLPPNATAAGYTLKSVLGSGGMGVVYVAQQHRPSRTVALKVIRPASATGQMLRRFEHEAELLARLQHPGIAQVYETGVADFGHGDQPFIAMELVRGTNLLEFARRQTLSVRERLDLVARICDAVQHAHQRGVIHRDLKPANILVQEEETGADITTHRGEDAHRKSGGGSSSSVRLSFSSSLPQPKILDFGVARAIDADLAVSMQTSAGQLIGTLPYMSPEQVAADPDAVDTRSDVYALGVILYQLLTERLPHELAGKSIAEAARIIQQEPPRRLGAIDGAFRGDIETIVVKAMEKDKERRYASASELAADIRRHLNDEPIIARPATALYAMRKFAARHKAVVAAAALLAIAFAGGFYLVNRARLDEREQREQAILAKNDAQHANEEAQRQREEAQEKAALAQMVIEFMSNDLLAQASPRLQPERDITLRAVLDRAASLVEPRFAGEPEAEAYIQYMLGATYESLGLLDLGEKHLRRSLDLRRQHLGDSDELTLNAQLHLAMTVMALGRYAEARELMQAAVDRCERDLGRDHPITIRALGELATLDRYEGRLESAEVIYQRLYETNMRLHGSEHADTVSTLGWAGEIHQMRGRYDLAEKDYREVLPLAEKVLGKTAQRTLIYMQNLAMMLRVQHKFDEALEFATRAHNLSVSANGADHEESLNAANSLALVYADMGRLQDAEQTLHTALEAAKASRGEMHKDTISLCDSLAGCLMRQGRFDAAEPLMQKVVDWRTQALGEANIDTLYASDMLAYAMRENGRADEAIAMEQSVVDRAKRVFAPGHSVTILAMNNLGRMLFEKHEFSESARVHGECLDMLRQHRPEQASQIGYTLVQHAQSLALMREFEQSTTELQEAFGIFENLGPAGHDGAYRAATSLESIFGLMQETERAAEWREKGRPFAPAGEGQPTAAPPTTAPEVG